MPAKYIEQDMQVKIAKKNDYTTYLGPKRRDMVGHGKIGI